MKKPQQSERVAAAIKRLHAEARGYGGKGSPIALFAYAMGIRRAVRIIRGALRPPKGPRRK